MPRNKKESPVASITPAAAQSAIVRLDWESEHFGVHAAQLATTQLSDDELAEILQQARRGRIELVVWPAENGRDVSRALLGDFHGMLVDRKATFVRPLDARGPDIDSARATDPLVVEYNRGTACDSLVELALAAGAYSRFRLDPRIPQERFEAMYHRWIARSVAHELADIVLVAPPSSGSAPDDDRLLGMISLSEADGIASIGLVAVAAEVRGRGIGSALIRAAHGWMRNRGAGEARVVTQLANRPACQLYERSGYRLARVQPYFHFWL
jgi:dTDP-4-amino-4,6-dideoxy-D-galactose acyltransferase